MSIIATLKRRISPRILRTLLAISMSRGYEKSPPLSSSARSPGGVG